MERHGLALDDIREITGATESTASMWLRPYGSSIGASTLHSLVLTLNNRV